MNKKTYIISNFNNRYSTAIKLSEEEYKAIKWFIDFSDGEYDICLADDFADEIDSYK